MKKFRIFVAVALLSLFGTLNVLAGNPVTPEESLWKQIRKKVDYPKNIETKTSDKVWILFTVTENNQINVIKTKSENPNLAEYVKSTLNGTSVVLPEGTSKEAYCMNINFYYFE